MNEIKKIIRPYTCATLGHIEKWLSHMATNGWVLIKVSGWIFFFEHGNKEQRLYCGYSAFDRHQGIFHDFYSVKQLYKKAKSKLNKIECDFFEVDISKIDSKYTNFILFRNRYYLKQYIMLMIVGICLSIISSIIAFFETKLLILFIFSFGIVVYSVILIFIISNYKK